MSSTEHQKKIRQIAAARGTDPLMALRAADAAAALQRLIHPASAVVWPDQYGGIAWEALTSDSRVSGTTPENDSAEVQMVFGPEGPANPGLWKDVSAALAGRSTVLTLSVLAEKGPEPPSDPSPDRSDDRPVVRLLRRLLEKIAPSDESEASIALAISGPSDDRLILTGTDDLDSGLRLAPAGKRAAAHLPEGFFPVDGRTPLRERLAAGEVLALSGLVPVIPLAAGEATGSVETVSRMAASGASFVLMLTAPWSALSLLSGIEGLALLSPGSPGDIAAAVAWVGRTGSAAVILDTGDDAHPERKVFGQGWETGQGIIVRDSRKGSAGNILLVAPGRSAAVASRAADRLVKDNISVSVLSMRFLSPLDTQHLENLTAESDVTVIVEESGFPGDLRSRILRQKGSSAGRNLMTAPDGIDAVELAAMASRELREQRIRQTVDDVKADRWR